MILWTPEEGSGVWMDYARVGEVGGTYIQGFFGGLFGPGGRQIVSHGFHGAFYCWEAEEAIAATTTVATSATATTIATETATATATTTTDATTTMTLGGGAGDDVGSGAAATTSDTTTDGKEATAYPKRWVQKSTPSGHFAGVRDMAWDPSGYCLVTVSDDQTTRLFMPCKSTLEGTAGGGSTCGGSARDTLESWNEVSRPQVHGYDMRCVTFTSSYELITGADEKVIRVFEAPDTYFNAVKCLLDADENTVAKICSSARDRALGASIPALGLSNKAVFTAEKAADQEADPAFVPSVYALDGVVLPFARRDLSTPPIEEDLVQNTLWSVVARFLVSI
jgi:hypothetical protein